MNVPQSLSRWGLRDVRSCLAAGAGLLGVEEGDRDHGGRDPLLVAVELADLDLGARLGVLDGDPAQRDVLAQDRAPGAACDHPDLGAPDVQAVAVPGGLLAAELEPDELAL